MIFCAAYMKNVPRLCAHLHLWRSFLFFLRWLRRTQKETQAEEHKSSFSTTFPPPPLRRPKRLLTDCEAKGHNAANGDVMGHLDVTSFFFFFSFRFVSVNSPTNKLALKLAFSAQFNFNEKPSLVSIWYLRTFQSHLGLDSPRTLHSSIVVHTVDIKKSTHPCSKARFLWPRERIFTRTKKKRLLSQMGLSTTLPRFEAPVKNLK